MWDEVYDELAGFEHQASARDRVWEFQHCSWCMWCQTADPPESDPVLYWGCERNGTEWMSQSYHVDLWSLAVYM